jgi:DGQHR domain-containing protein
MTVKDKYQLRVDEMAKKHLEPPVKRNFSAVLGKQGSYDIFTIMMPFSVLAELFDPDIGSAFLRSQRPVNKKRAKAVTSYVRENSKTYVLPSITATIEDYKPREEINVTLHNFDFETNYNTLNSDEQAYGTSVVLTVPETSRWWFIDGQHRATGIQGLQVALSQVGMSIEDVFPDDTIAVMVRLDTGLEDRQNQFSVINSNMVKPNANLNSLYSKKVRTGTIINDAIHLKFKLSELEFDKTACSVKNP